MPLRLGDLLLEAGHIEPAQLEEALESQESSGLRLGAELVSLGHLSEVQLAQILSNQLAVPWASLYHIEFSRDLLRRVPAEVCEATTSIPIYIRRVKRTETLFVAMDDPSDEENLALLRDASGMQVKPMVAPPSEIRNAIRVYYLGLSPETPAPPPGGGPGRRDTHAPPPDELTDEVLLPEHREEEAGRVDSSAEQNEADDPVALGAAPAKHAEGELVADPPTPTLPPAALEGEDPDFVTLTLLDGTVVRLPTRRETTRDDHRLTASDLVGALLAKSQGRPMEAVLPENLGWEVLFATLLQLLLRKGLVADWEFVEALRKNLQDTPSAEVALDELTGETEI